MKLASGILITHQSDETLAELQSQSTEALFTIIRSEDDKGKAKEFLVEHAQEAIAKAYIASESLNYLVLIAPKFSEIAQNRLLKIIEEPPKNKHFILITQSKSALLPTIQSRLPVTVLHDAENEETLALDIHDLNLQKVYDFTQKHKSLSAVECRVLVEKIALSVMKSGSYEVDESLLKLFSNAIEVLDMGSPTSFVLNTLLLKLLAKKRKA